MINNGMLTAAHGLRALQSKVDTISNNLANVNTTGYKGKEAVFGEMLYRQMNNQPGGETAGQVGRNTEEMIRRGSGLLLTGTPTQFTQGVPQETGNPLDFMIGGTGFFRVARDLNNNGDIDASDIRYTRNGAFQLSPIDDQLYLVTANGEFVLNEDDEPIAIEGTSSVKVLSNGTIVEIGSDGEEYDIGSIGLFTFPNLQMLVRDGSGNWLLHPEADVTTNEPTLVEGGYAIVQGALEGSNVDLTKEMADLIATQRTMSLMGKALTMSDEMMGMANDLIRR